MIWTPLIPPNPVRWVPIPPAELTADTTAITADSSLDGGRDTGWSIREEFQNLNTLVAVLAVYV